ncbi:MAG: hypothetical protein C0432_03115 [Candidatus Puniceispirillum sp.]|nr:hypothetical protein [Candidatus Pelagibacter sp.]MBA4283264.1 hypothetical protein [Candidatus Puniceispirillum sp.]
MMSSPKSNSNRLSPEIKKSVAIILIGNFLEFFDLLLAVHMTITLTKVFLPEDSQFTPLLATFTFCSSFCIRPLAALFWGYIGDAIGRVPVLISTTFLMSISCILIPNIPPYAEWGITSSALFLFMRLIQGFASGGECIAADVFITETIPKPKVYFCSALVEATCSLGGLVACGIGTICITLSPENGWKIPFYIGSGIAVLGTIARKTLKETPEFLKTLQENAERKKIIDFFSEINLKNNNIFALFAMYLLPAVAFYFSLAYIPTVLAKEFNLPTNLIMMQTTIVLIITMCCEIFYGYLGLRYDPFSILKTKLYLLILVIPISIWTYIHFKSPFTLFLIQSSINFLGQGLTPATPIINKSFPIAHRYTYLLLIWAVSHSGMYLLTGFVCEAISNFVYLSIFLLACAGISLLGTHFFQSHTKLVSQKINTAVSEKIQKMDINQFAELDAQLNLNDGQHPLYDKLKRTLIKDWIKKHLP